ncbi:MAG: hypothetical protein AVO33_07530 [delta proteobacterium ML8_F1]|nr:MAG: hypothetical protein AVO33_07530 [delta proteobacterium ML8_F1]
MKSFCLCSRYETLISMRLAGIKGLEIHSEEELKEALEELMGHPEYGLILISEALQNMARDHVMALKLSQRDRMIIQIPEPGGYKDRDYMMRYIRESIGIKV